MQPAKPSDTPQDLEIWLGDDGVPMVHSVDSSDAPDRGKVW